HIPNTPTRVLYIYYRTPDQADELERELQAFIRHVEASTNIRGRLLCRRSSDGKTLTWLETYEAVPEGFKLTLRKLWLGFNINKPPYGERREEEFVEMPAPPS